MRMQVKSPGEGSGQIMLSVYYRHLIPGKHRRLLLHEGYYVYV